LEGRVIPIEDNKFLENDSERSEEGVLLHLLGDELSAQLTLKLFILALYGLGWSNENDIYIDKTDSGCVAF
jgi:hypothetical protein